MIDASYRELLDDMTARPDRYSMPLMRRLLGERMDSAFSGDPDSPAGRFLMEGRTLDQNALVQEGIIPDISFRFVHHLRHRMMPVTVTPKKYTEVLLVGKPGSGKTSVLSGLLSFLYENRLAYPRCTVDPDGLDKSAENCLELIHCLRDHYFPARADQPFVRFNLVDAGQTDFGWSFVDLRARDILKLTGFDSVSHGLSSIDSSLSTPNRKCMFFVVDTEAWLREEEEGIVDDQDFFLVKVLTVLSNDGVNPSKPASGCTFSKVSSVAVILTKTDVWASRIPSGTRREAFFHEMLVRKLSPFRNNLGMLCKKYGINRNIDNEVWAIPFSLGTLAVGNLVGYLPSDSEQLAQFLLRDRRGRGSWSFLF